MRGPLACPHFRLESWLKKINFLVPQVVALHAEFLHLIDVNGELSREHSQILGELLDYGVTAPSIKTNKQDEQVRIIVVPKVGTVSEWSGRASDIVHYCGLSHVKRIERGIVYTLKVNEKLTWGDQQAIADILHSPIEDVFYNLDEIQNYFLPQSERVSQSLDISKLDNGAVEKAIQNLKIHVPEIESDEAEHFFSQLKGIREVITDVELATFAKIHSRQQDKKYLSAHWLIDDKLRTLSLSTLIQNTYQKNARGIEWVSNDNTAVIASGTVNTLDIEPDTKTYVKRSISMASVLTAICSQSYTGSVASEIQGEVAVGRGSAPRFGFCGFTVSNLHIPNFIQSWEQSEHSPKKRSTALELILEAPIGNARFNAEFGRPNVCGFFRTFEQCVHDEDKEQVIRGYHKPLMVTGGVGVIQREAIQRKVLEPGMQVIILGGPVTLAGTLDRSRFDLTEFTNQSPEMQRRCQQVINHCVALHVANPIVAIYSPEIGGLSTLLPEIAGDSKLGLKVWLPKIHSESNLSPVERWCNEAQGRYVIIIDKKHFEIIEAISHREACPLSVIGELSTSGRLEVMGSENEVLMNFAVDKLFEPAVSSRLQVNSTQSHIVNYESKDADLEEAALQILRLPCVADKSFLITICDRSIGGLVSRDAFVGPWQVAVSDCAVSARGFDTYQGDAVAIGERAPIAILNTTASARMAIGEAITNVAAANIGALSDIRLSISWTGNLKNDNDKKELYESTEILTQEFCPALGLTIPVIQEPVSLQSSWQESGKNYHVSPPVSLVASAMAPVMDVRRTLTPLLETDESDSILLFVDLSGNHQRLGQSAYSQVTQRLYESVPDVEEPGLLKEFFILFQQLSLEDKVLAYHDRSDGGLFVTLCEMAFASHVGLQIDISGLGSDPRSVLFNEELGVVLQIRAEEAESVIAEFHEVGLEQVSVIATLDHMDKITVVMDDNVILAFSRIELQQAWSETQFHLKSLRDNPRCAKKEFDAIADQNDPGFSVHLSFDVSEDIAAPFVHVNPKPKVAILREQGIYGHYEMAAAFDRAQFDPVDVHMNDLESARLSLADFQGLVLCGGVSFGDILGAGQGWAMRILYSERLREQFEQYFHRADTFSLGVSNGCQVLSKLRSLIPGTELWPSFTRNFSEQFECRLCLVEIQKSPSIVLKDMEGSRIPIPVAHREGRADFLSDEQEDEAFKKGLVSVCYVDNQGRKTKAYPHNPNGSTRGVTGMTNQDGRVTLMMPHPERVFRSVQHSWHPDIWGEDGPWLRIFRNARRWLG